MVWLLRETVETEEGLAMVPAWFEPKWGWVSRNDEMIGKLVETANSLWSDLQLRPVLELEREIKNG